MCAVCNSSLSISFLVKYKLPKPRSESPSNHLRGSPTPSMEDIPPEIQLEILLRLPIHSLARSSCVCKYWRTSIKDPDFITRYHTHRTLYVVHGPQLFSANLIDALSHSRETIEFNQIPLGYDNFVPTLIGSSNGLLCVNFLNRFLAFYNTITLSKTIVEIPTSSNSSSSACFGFGHIPLSDDYAVLRVRKFYRAYDNRFGLTEFFNEFQLYSFRRCTWIPVMGYPRDLYSWTYSNIHCVNEAFHWLAIKKIDRGKDDRFLLQRTKFDEKQVIVRYDLNGEEFGEIELPGGIDDGNRAMGSMNLGGYLCVWTENPVVFDVWIMKEYGIEESWYKLLSIKRVRFKSLSPSPLAYVEEHGKVLLQGLDKSGNMELFWYNLKVKGAMDGVEIDDDDGRALKKRKFKRISH